MMNTKRYHDAHALIVRIIKREIKDFEAVVSNVTDVWYTINYIG